VTSTASRPKLGTVRRLGPGFPGPLLAAKVLQRAPWRRQASARMPGKKGGQPAELIETDGGAAGRQAQIGEGYRLLLVDDEEHVREALRIVLEQRGYRVVDCSDAQQALERLRTGVAPDLILLDLMMPNMDGWQFRLEQKRNAAWAQIPVIAMSADQSAKAQAMDAHCYLPKPFDHIQLCETIERVLASVRTRAQETPAQTSFGSLGRLAGELVEHLEQPIGYTLANLQLAKSKVEELGARLTPRSFS